MAFIRAEYLIAKLLSEKDFIIIPEFNSYGQRARSLSIENKTGLCFLTSRVDIRSALDKYPDYFRPIYDGNGKLIGITAEKSKAILDQFVHTLSPQALEILESSYLEN